MVLLCSIKGARLQALVLQLLLIFSAHVVFFSPCMQSQELSTQDFDALLQDLRSNQFFTAVSILRFLSPPFLTPRITLLIPTDAAIASAVNRFSGLALAYPAIVQFHILERNLAFRQLQLLPEGTWLPTMLPGKGVQVTSSNPANFSLNDAVIVKPDICPNARAATISCMGIDSLLDLSSMLVPEPQNPPFLPVPAAPPAG